MQILDLKQLQYYDGKIKNYISTSYAPLQSPSFTGTPTSVTPSAGDSSTKIATTKYVQTELGTAKVASAGEFTAAKSVTLTGDVTGSASSKGGWSIAATLASSGVTANTYGPSANASPAHSGTFTVPKFTVDAKGRVTSASNITITLPASGNVDTKVTQTVTANTDEGKYPILAKNATTTATITDTSRFVDGITIQPSTGAIQATKFIGAVEGNASSADSVPWSGIDGKPSTFAPSSHNQASNTINAMTGYSKPSSTSAIGTSDTLNAAIGKLEKALDGKAASATTLAGYNISDAKIASGVITLGSNTITPLTSSSSLNAAKLTGTAAVNTTGKATTAGTADKVASSLTLKVKSGTTEGTDLYTFNGSGAKTLDIKQGSNVTLTAAEGSLTIAAKDTVYTHPTTSGNKHIPSGGSSGQILRWSADGTAAWGADNNTTYSTFVKSGSGAAAGLVPAPSTTAGTTKYLREDGTWAVPPDNNTTYSNFVKSGSGAAAGLVPAPSTTAGTTKYLREDGTWQVPPDNNTVYTHPTTTGNKHIPSGGSSGQFLGWDSDGTAKWVANPNTDTKNTAGSTDSSSKLFLVGATSQAANPQTYSHDTAYVGTDGCLYSGGAKVLTAHQTLPTLSYTESGSGNAITGISVSNHAITATKGSTFLTSHQSLANYVTLNGAQTISAVKTFTAAPAVSMSQPAAVMSLSGATKKTNPSSNLYGNIFFQDKTTTVNTAKRAGSLDCGINTNGQTELSLRAFDWSKEDSTNGAISIYYPSGGTPYTAAPTPATSDNSTKIATTAFVKAQGYITGSGNAATATKLATARAINGTNFDGSAAITTANWGTARNISISDSDGTNTGTAVSVNGSANATLKLPATIKASITGNCSGSSGSCTGNAATATKTTATIAVDTTGELVRATMGSNDVFRIAVGGASNAGWAELATGDDYNEPIYVRQYQGSFATLKRTATLLDASGNTSFPGTVTAVGFSGPLTGNVTGNCSGFSGSCTGNAATATKLATARTINVQDSSATNTGTAASFDGSGNATIKLPATIKATITGNCSGSSGSCTGNAATATKLATARTINGVSFDGSANITVADSTKVAKAGDTMTGQLTIGSSQAIHFKNTNITRGTAPSASQYPFYILLKDNADKTLGGLYYEYLTDKSAKSHLMCYQGTTNANTWKSIGIGYDASGNPYTWSITPGFGNNSTQIATTEFVWKNAAKHFAAATNIYVAKAASGNGSGSNTSNYMSLADLRNYLATVHMHSSTADLNGSYNLQILFKAGESFGNATFDATKMPGVRNLILNTSTGTASTTSNYSTNSPTFGNITVSGDIAVTIRNINCTGRISAQWGAYISIDTYVSASSFSAVNNGYLNVVKNMTINVCDAHTDYLFNASTNGIIAMWPGATVTLNFRQQCYYTRALFTASANGTMWLGYNSLKLTGTQPIAVWGGSGTLTGTSQTAAGTAAKAVTLASGQTFTLKTNATAKVKFTIDNTAANPTLNINSTGAKPIWWNGAAVSANMLMKNITYDVKYDGTHFVIQNAVKRLTNNDFGIFRSAGNYNQTYNSGSWNFTGWSLYYGTGVENGNWRGSHIGNIQQNVTTSDNTFPILFSGTANATANTSTYPYFGSGVKINPKTSTIYATTFSGNAPTPAAADNSTKIATTAWVRGRLHISTANPSGGTDGDIWFKYA